MTEAVWQGVRCQNIDFYTQQTFQLSSDRANIKERRFRCRVNQDIEVAVFSVCAVHHRAENTGVEGMMALDDLDDRLTMAFESCGWAHRQIMLRMRLTGKQGWQRMISHSTKKKPANFRLRAFEFWLPDLDSNQGPAD